MRFLPVFEVARFVTDSGATAVVNVIQNDDAYEQNGGDVHVSANPFSKAAKLSHLIRNLA